MCVYFESVQSHPTFIYSYFTVALALFMMGSGNFPCLISGLFSAKDKLIDNSD